MFGRIREQTNKQTHGHPIALEEEYESHQFNVGSIKENV